MNARLALASTASWLVIAALLALVAYASLGHYDHNDHMYAVAPVLGLRLRPYADFPFVQTPLSLLLYELVLRLVGEAHLYTSLRILSLALNLVIVALGIALCRRQASAKTWASLVFVALYVGFHPDEKIGAEIGNYTLSLSLTVGALAWLEYFRGRALTPFVVGVLAGLSLSAKLSYIFVVAGFGLIFLVWERTPAGLLRRMAAYGLGALIGVAPILYFLASDFDHFVFENVHFHYLSNLYRAIPLMTWLSGLPLPLFSGGSGLVALTLLAIVSLLVGLAAWLTLTLFPRLRALMLPLTALERDTSVLGAAMLVGAVTPGVIFQQYEAGPAFAVFLFAVLYLDRLWRSDRLAPIIVRTGPIAAALIALSYGAAQAYDMTRETLGKQRDGAYGIVAVAEARARIAKVVAQIDAAHPHCHDDLVTAVGVPAIGTGVTFSPISSVGSFAMRLDPIFKTEAPNWRWISDPTRYLTPRSLILSGFYVDPGVEPKSPFEPVMDGYAASHGFEAIPVGPFIYKPIILYAPPQCRIPLPPA
jgi:hypothetical protein